MPTPPTPVVAALVGYENLVDAEIGDGGVVEVAGRPTDLRCSAGTGTAIVAAWAAGVQLRPAGAPGIPATVEHVSPGPGRWEITLAAPMALRAHVPLAASPPRPGERLAVALDPALAAVLACRRTLRRPEPPRDARESRFTRGSPDVHGDTILVPADREERIDRGDIHPGPCRLPNDHAVDRRPGRDRG